MDSFFFHFFPLKVCALEGKVFESRDAEDECCRCVSTEPVCVVSDEVTLSVSTRSLKGIIVSFFAHFLV